MNADAQPDQMVRTKKAKRTVPVKVFLTLMVILALIVVASVLLFRSCGGKEETGGSDAPDIVTAAREHTLVDAPQADFLSIFVYDGNGGVASFMVGGKTDEFNSFASAIANAKPVAAYADESFSDLLILSFGDKDTMELSYSRKRDLLMLGDEGFTPSEDLKPKIAEIERKFN